MKQQVIAAELSATGAQELLAATSSAHLACNAEDGTPRVIPVGFFWTGTEFVISTAATAPKVPALKASPEVALSIEGSGLDSACPLRLHDGGRIRALRGGDLGE